MAAHNSRKVAQIVHIGDDLKDCMIVILHSALKLKLVESCLRGQGFREGSLCMSCRICAYPFKRANKERVYHNLTIKIEGIRRKKNEHESVLELGACGIFRKQPHLVSEGQNNSMTQSILVVASPTYSPWWYELLQRGVKATK